jgi:hypothetical protein
VNGFTPASSNLAYRWRTTPSETAMQRYPDDLTEAERKIARRWTLASVGVYASLLAALALFAALSPSQPGNVASNDPAAKFSVASATREPARQKPAKAQPSRACIPTSC